MPGKENFNQARSRRNKSKVFPLFNRRLQIWKKFANST